MSVKTYLWIEDRKGKASYTFWKTMMAKLCPEGLLKARKITVNLSRL